MSRDDGLPPNLHAPTFVNDVGQYFVTKIETIQRKLDIESFDSVISLFDSVPDDSPSVFVPLFTDFENLPNLIHALVSRRSDYCNSLLYGVPNCHLHKFQRVQNAAARLIFEESRYCHVTPLLKSLHWLPVKYRIIFKVLLITFKAIHDLTPVYISELISIRDVS